VTIAGSRSTQHRANIAGQEKVSTSGNAADAIVVELGGVQRRL
jgi:hypothetical protein